MLDEDRRKADLDLSNMPELIVLSSIVQMRQFRNKKRELAQFLRRLSHEHRSVSPVTEFRSRGLLACGVPAEVYSHDHSHSLDRVRRCGCLSSIRQYLPGSNWCWFSFAGWSIRHHKSPVGTACGADSGGQSTYEGKHRAGSASLLRSATLSRRNDLVRILPRASVCLWRLASVFPWCWRKNRQAPCAYRDQFRLQLFSILGRALAFSGRPGQGANRQPGRDGPFPGWSRHAPAGGCQVSRLVQEGVGNGSHHHRHGGQVDRVVRAHRDRWKLTVRSLLFRT